ncbi:hypothetical protein [Haloparvum sp. PAK95]|uniref:hypothetical protein n=1 Tax=Haloparvum sp. PAK95 TaxID=3418962 RepID=UPI003D2EBAAD
MSLYDAVADLPLTIEREERAQRRSDTTSGFERVTTEVSLVGDEAVGRGEDVAYEVEAHEALATLELGAFDLAGGWTFGEFSDHLAETDLFPEAAPGREHARHYRRWAYESAALDLALRQADTDLGEVLDRDPDPVRFVVSTRLGDPPTPERVESLLADDPAREFKLDPTPEWTGDLVTALADTDAVRVVDLKGFYQGTDVDVPTDPELYELVVDAFPKTVIEDPDVAPETREILESEADRIAFDYPVTGVESLQDLPIDPGWCNVKPSRFGSVESLLETVEYCEQEGIQLYGGGQFELGVGRDQIQILASLLYADAPNDVAPREFNDPDRAPPFPESPLPAASLSGFGWD